MPWRVSTRIAAALICGASTSFTQPASSATRPFFRGPRAGKVCGASGALRRAPGRKTQHGGDPLEPDRLGERREWLTDPRRAQRKPEALRIRHELGEHRPQDALAQRAAVRLLDMDAGMVDEVHVVHARRTCRHAGQARQAAIDVQDDLCRRRTVVLQHVLDEVDAPARRIELVAVEHIGRTGRGAEAAMHAGAQDLFRFRDIRIGELREGEGGLHGYTPAHMRPALSTPCGSKLSRTRFVNAASAAGSGSKTSTAARTAAGARMSVA